MERITAHHPLSQSADLVKENLETLKRLFPTIVKEGKIDVDELKALLDEEIETNEEYYRFSWAGKSEARREANKPSTATLRPNKADSKEWDTTGNIFIEGDNLEVLKLLQKSYAGKIKMMYFDPPYNTGKDFVYKDNYADNLGNYLALTGQTDEEGKKLSSNTESDGRYHSNWLNMIYPRLKLARNLLTEDGVVFISIDDNEVNNLRKLCDEVFGEDNFVGNFIWRKKAGGGQADDFFVKEHEYILVYRKSNLLVWKDDEILDSEENYNKFDDLGKFKVVKLAKWGNTARRIDRPSMYFSIKNPTGSDNFPIAPDGSDGRWRMGKIKIQELIQECLIHWENKNGNWIPYEKIYFDPEKIKTIKTRSILYDIAQTGDGSNLLTKIFNKKDLFENPKPIELLNVFIRHNLLQNEIILDFFAGSGTTAHSIMQLNSEDIRNRKYICVQLPEPTAEDSEAYNAGYDNIAEICKERIRRAGKNIILEKTAELEKLKKSIEGKMLQEETQEQIETLQLTINNLDIGFKAFKLDSSNIHAWDGSVENFEQNLFNAQNNIKENRTEEDVLFEILLKYGLDLTVPIEEKEVNACKVYSIGSGVLFVCLSDNITIPVADAIGKWKEELQPATSRVLFKDNGFKDDIAKTNSIQILRQYGIEEVNSL